MPNEIAVPSKRRPTPEEMLKSREREVQKTVEGLRRKTGLTLRLTITHYRDMQTYTLRLGNEIISTTMTVQEMREWIDGYEKGLQHAAKVMVQAMSPFSALLKV